MDTFNKYTKGEWHESLFTCYDNPLTCIITYFLPCIYVGLNAKKSGCLPHELIGMCLFFVPIAGNLTMSQTRRKTRELYRIEGSVLEDFCITCFCACCGIIQVYDQLEQPLKRKKDVKTGLQGETNPNFVSPINRSSIDKNITITKEKNAMVITQAPVPLRDIPGITAPEKPPRSQVTGDGRAIATTSRLESHIDNQMENAKEVDIENVPGFGI